MAGIKLELNRNVDENYAFFCPHALIHLSQSQPMGVAPRLSSYILTALRFGTLIDVDGVVDLETGELKQSSEENPDASDGEENSDASDSVENPDASDSVESIFEEVTTDGVQDSEKEEKEEVQVTPKKSRKRSVKTAE